MRHKLFGVVEGQYRRQSELNFDIGDTVVVTTRIIEGEKERLQDYEGTVIARKGAGLDAMFTVRRLVGNEGVERVFPLHSPKVVSIRTVRSGKIRRAKLYFLRDRVGKARKLRERRVSAEARAAAAGARLERDRRVAEAQEAVAAAN
ncbi:MAG: 50S ribosomal protein L19 [Phycisphaerales bacterium]|nr:50S ribosomal protein L19 [Phycisphaerales bacterium]